MVMRGGSIANSGHRPNTNRIIFRHFTFWRKPKACEYFEMQGEEPVRQEIAQPDYENAKPLGRPIKRTRQRREYQNRDLKNSISLYLPSNNAAKFAAELRQHWDKSYLIECLVALKILLEDDEDESR